MTDPREGAKHAKEVPSGLSPAAGSQVLNVEEISAIIVDTGLQIHSKLGPGLLESVYESVLARALEQRGLHVERQKPITFEFEGQKFADGFRADLLINGIFLIELKSVEALAPVHFKQTLTYLRLLDLPLGLLMNFGAALFKDGVKRVVNKHTDTSSSQLRINQIPRT